MSKLKNLVLIVICLALCGFGPLGGGGSSSGGGTTITSGAGEFGAATAQSGAVLTGVGVNPTLSSNIQQPATPIGSSATKVISATTTTGTINTPTGTVNGDLEIVFISLNNTTSGTFVPPSGWAAIANCNTSGNTVQAQAFSHTASSEGGTIAAFTWTTAGTGMAWASTYRNAGIDVCVASNAAAATTFVTAGLTAAATSDRIVVVGTQPSSGQFVHATSALNGMSYDAFGVLNTTYGYEQLSYPITGTTVAGFSFTSGSLAWAGFQIGLSYVSSSTAGPPGALTYNEFGSAYLAGLNLGNGINIAGTAFSLLLPTPLTNNGGIGGIDSNGIPRCLLCETTSGLGLTIGESNANNSVGFNVTINGNTTLSGGLNLTTIPITTSTIGASSFCMGTSATIAAATTDFIACGENPGVTVIATETNDQMLIPAACKISRLFVTLTTAANTNTPVITVDKNTTGQTLTCTVANTATTCSDVTHSFTTVAGDLLSVKVVNPTSANATGVVYMGFQINC